jgi:DDE superfamily endonuclease
MPGDPSPGRGAIYLADEAGIRSNCHASTTWPPVGQTPEVKNIGARFPVNMISAASAKGALRFAVYEGNTNAGILTDFCKRLLHSPGSVYLIVDGHPAHRATATKEFATFTEGRLKLVFLPRLLARAESRRMGLEERQASSHRQDRRHQQARPASPPDPMRSAYLRTPW